MTAPTIERTQRGAQHIALFLAHWAGGHTVSEEEIIRRIVKARQEAHATAVAEAGRQARAAHKKATRLRRSAEENGGLVPAQMTALATADFEARRHDAAMSALGEFTMPVLDPGHVRHRRHRIAAWRCAILASPVAGVLAASWMFSGNVFLFSVLGGVGACLARGDKPFALAVRAVPAELVAATPLVLPIASASVVEPGDEQESELVLVDSGEWRDDLRLYVEHAVAHADLQGRAGVHVVDLLNGLQESGRYLGFTKSSFPAKLRDAGLPVTGISIKGDNQLGVRYDQLAKELGRSPRLPAHLVPDLTADETALAGEGSPFQSPSPASRQTA
ncbi:hypothetical protein [Streptomyces sp. CB01881]|uniref:hypothetical protein n=1 Tax=Streptomyces sp. CB01881 TaxID=2078691 RepID=UPI000CDBCC16|nr:hypothetical protein [Streptomyces sp. CB01881]AUY51262.1 hypothetical protein C2142_22590 [Streptomyces sp. CB01881]TYC74648.1 hypothetical protein EH183_22565 [Streptomyces sp. CB01881]